MSPGHSGSDMRSSVTRPTRGSRTSDGENCTRASPKSSSGATESPEEAAELLSLHYSNAGRWDDAWRHSLAAAARARDVYANVDAARFYERALEAAGQLKTLETSAVEAAWRGLGEVRDAAGDYNGALAAMKESLRLLKDDPVAQARIHEARALARFRLGAYSDALRDVTAGLNRVKALETPEAKDVAHDLLARRAQIYLQQGKAA